MSSTLEPTTDTEAPILGPTAQTAAAPPPPERLLSLDAFRGAIMLVMASSGFGIPQVAEHFTNSPVWAFLGYEFDHSRWTGCTLWDMIQPSFMFMVGVAVPWSVANRGARGQSFPSMLGHAMWRAFLLVALAILLQSNWSQRTDWTFPNVLAQVGLGYPFLFLLAFTKPKVQWAAAFGILFAWWLLFALWPLPPPGFDYSSVGVTSDWPRMTGFAAHWEKNTNPAAAFDVGLLNLFLREKPFLYNEGGYTTLNFVPSLATMVFGLLAGGLMRSGLAVTEKLRRLVLAGLAGMVLGALLHAAGVCPIVKQIWTPSWALFSSGIVALLLAGFVAIIDWKQKRRWAFPFLVAGVNPITLYVLWQVFSGPVRNTLKIHLGQDIFNLYGELYAPMVQRISVLLIFWLILYWMWRRRLYIRV